MDAADASSVTYQRRESTVDRSDERCGRQCVAAGDVDAERRGVSGRDDGEHDHRDVRGGSCAVWERLGMRRRSIRLSIADVQGVGGPLTIGAAAIKGDGTWDPNGQTIALNGGVVQRRVGRATPDDAAGGGGDGRDGAAGGGIVAHRRHGRSMAARARRGDAEGHRGRALGSGAGDAQSAGCCRSIRIASLTFSTIRST